MSETTLPPGARTVLRRTNDDVAVIRSELDGYYVMFRGFKEMEPENVMLELSAIHARLVEIRSRLVRKEDRASQSLRTQEVDPLISASDFQFKLFSRLCSLRENEWRMANNGV